MWVKNNPKKILLITSGIVVAVLAAGLTVLRVESEPVCDLDVSIHDECPRNYCLGRKFPKLSFMLSAGCKQEKCKFFGLKCKNITLAESLCSCEDKKSKMIDAIGIIFEQVNTLNNTESDLYYVNIDDVKIPDGFDTKIFVEIINLVSKKLVEIQKPLHKVKQGLTI